MEKRKQKIEKLLNLSLSDNEHEAKLALDRALALMNKHNITENEVYKQQMISKKHSFDKLAIIPEWLAVLYGNLSALSGCIFTYKNGIKGLFSASGRISGRERDVENAYYIIHVLYLQIGKLSKEYSKRFKGNKKRVMNKSYKMGLIITITDRLVEQSSAFFNEQVKGTDLVCVDIKSRFNDAENYIKDLLNGKIKDAKSKSKYEREALNEGREDGNKIDINQGVSARNNVKMIEA